MLGDAEEDKEETTISCERCPRRRLPLHAHDPETMAPTAQDTKGISAASRDKFLQVWPTIRDELLAYMDFEKMPAEAKEWFRKVG